MVALDPICFMLNTVAMGDVIASVPVVKYMVTTYPDLDYRVVAKPAFRTLFPFVPDEKFLDYDKSENEWGIPKNFPIAAINKKNEARLTRNTPKHMHLSQFASLMLADRIIPTTSLDYVPLVPVAVTKFGLGTSYAVLVTSYRDVTRMWRPEYILGVALWLKQNGVTPVFIGKTDMDLGITRDAVKPKNSLPDDISEYGIDLRNKTTIPELASIMHSAKAVCGLDSGPIHLAGTTSVPIVCGYTSVSSENRIPLRQAGKTLPIEPNIDCIGCESKWHTTYWNFEQCPRSHVECCNQMTADKFIAALTQVL